MVAIYGHKWSSVHGLSPQADDGTLNVSGETWAKGLSGLEGRQFGVGLEGCLTRQDAWPPTLPEFRALCLDIPSFAKARQMLQPGFPDITAFGRLMWGFLDPYSLKQVDGREQRRMELEAYELACAHVMAGKEMPPAIQPALAHSPEVERALYDKLHHERMKGLTDE